MTGHAAPPEAAAAAPLVCERSAALADSAGVLGAIGYGSAPGVEPPLVERIALPLLGGDAGCVDIWRSAGPLVEGRTGCVRWRSAGGWLFGSVALDEAAAGIEALTQRAYRDIFQTLDATRHAHLLRLWNYLPAIHADEAGLERYRRFNLGRQRAFVQAGRTLLDGAPAACALGSAGGALHVFFLAGRSPALALENPRQMSAYRYPAAYGPASPTFSRAALADAGAGHVALFVSGTASIVGHASVHAGDVAAQTRETLANLEALLGTARGRCSAPFALAALTPVVYVRRPEDAAKVQGVLDAARLRQPVYVQGDVCRSELLVEIEAYALLPGVLHAGSAGAARATADNGGVAAATPCA